MNRHERNETRDAGQDADVQERAAEPSELTLFFERRGAFLFCEIFHLIVKTTRYGRGNCPLNYESGAFSHT
jgi:hypothetical protein